MMTSKSNTSNFSCACRIFDSLEKTQNTSLCYEYNFLAMQQSCSLEPPERICVQDG